VKALLMHVIRGFKFAELQGYNHLKAEIPYKIVEFIFPTYFCILIVNKLLDFKFTSVKKGKN
jgi:hypothetical protein